MIRPGRAAPLALLTALACRPPGPTAEGFGTTAPSPAPAATSGAAAPAPPPASAASAPAANSAPDGLAPLPPLSGVARLTLEQLQGGAAYMRCNWVIYELSVDLASNAWTHGLCQSTTKGKGATPTQALTKRHGTLTAEQRGRLEAAYGKLGAETARGCGHDGGTLSLALERDGAPAVRYVDENWGCKKPPPEVVRGLREFATLVASFAPLESEGRVSR